MIKSHRLNKIKVNPTFSVKGDSAIYPLPLGMLRSNGGRGFKACAFVSPYIPKDKYTLTTTIDVTMVCRAVKPWH